MISSLYEEYCADCRGITEHEFLASNTVQCNKCRRLILNEYHPLLNDVPHLKHPSTDMLIRDSPILMFTFSPSDVCRQHGLRDKGNTGVPR